MGLVCLLLLFVCFCFVFNHVQSPESIPMEVQLSIANLSLLIIAGFF